MFDRKMYSRHIIKTMMAILLALLPIFALSGCVTATKVDANLNTSLASGTTITAGVLTVGVDSANAPYAGTNSTGEIVGLDVDVAAAIADTVGLKLKVVDVGSGAKAALTGKKVDLVLGMQKSGVSQSITYTPAYIDDGLSLYSLTSKAPSSVASANLKSSKTLVLQDSSAALKVESALGYSAVSTASSLAAAFTSLQQGGAPYLIADAVTGDYAARKYSDITRVGFLSADSVAPVYGAVLSSDTTLAQAVSDAIASLSKDGTMRAVLIKWLGSDGEKLLPSAVDTAALPKEF